MNRLICPHCGNENRPGSNFCNKCGTDLSEVQQPAAHSHPEADEQAQSTDRPQPNRPLPDAAAPDEMPSPSRENAEDRPLFDLGLASADHHKEAVSRSDSARRTEEPASFAPFKSLLAPIEVPDEATRADDVPPAKIPVSRETSQWMQEILTHASPLAGPSGPAGIPAPGNGQVPPMRRHWIFLLILAAVLLPLLTRWAAPAGIPHQWPGVDEAYAEVNRLPAGADVLLFWAYDPATAGEMDLVVEPILAHLILREVDLTFVSPMPLGPATAQRELQTTLGMAGITGDPTRAAARLGAYNIFLPGGAAVLPLLAQGSATPLDGGRHGAALLETMTRPRYATPALAVVVAADAEDVQNWVEMVQPLNRVPTVAVTAAGADPVVRPYLDSGQLSGLVSGFDGAYHYRARMERRPSEVELGAQRVQVSIQNWIQLTVLGLVVAGNLVGLLFRKDDNP